MLLAKGETWYSSDGASPRAQRGVRLASAALPINQMVSGVPSNLLKVIVKAGSGQVALVSLKSRIAADSPCWFPE